MDKINKAFSEYLNLQLVKMSFEAKHSVSQSEMSRETGVPQASLSQYMNGTRIPSVENAEKLADYFGPEVYEILEMPPKMPNDPLLKRVVYAWMKLQPDMQKRIVNKVEDAVAEWDDAMENFAGNVKR